MDGPAPLRFMRFGEIEGWPRDGHGAAFAAFLHCGSRTVGKPYRTGSFGIAEADLAPAFAAAREDPSQDARIFFERHFVPARIMTPGFVTGFYEPIVPASLNRTDRFIFPLLRSPADLVEITPQNRPAGWDADMRFGRWTGEGIVPFHDRAEIENGALDGFGLELAWLADPVDLFFIHVQGAARLVLPDGSTIRVTYAAKSGHPFTGPGRVLADRGEIAREDVTMQSIRAWLDAHPDCRDEVLRQNRSYIFFREAPVDAAALGPVAAAKVPLTAGRSLAVDRLLHTFGTPFFVHAPDMAFARLMVAQDTGSAIVGAARGDIFCGSGDEAGERAGVIRHAADFTMLVPLAAAERMR